MWKLCHKIQKFSKRCTLDFHWRMLGIEHDAVLIVIYIWRILEKPVTVVNRQWNDAVVLACRMVDTSCITFVLTAEQTFWITALFCQFCCRNGFWIFLRFGQIDGDIQCSKLGVGCPLAVFFDTLSSDIIAVTA